MIKPLTPLQFAALLMDTLERRSQGASQIVAAREACLEAGSTDDWAFAIIAVLNDSPSAAEAWAQRLTADHCRRLAEQMEASHAS